MAPWALYAMLASASFGLSAIPLRFAINKMGSSAQSEVILLSSCIGSLAGAIIYQFVSGKPALFANIERQAILYAFLSGLIAIAGSLSVIKALSTPASNVSSIMTLVNTNVFFTMIFGVALLREIPDGIGMVKLLSGAALIFAGSVVICR